MVEGNSNLSHLAAQTMTEARRLARRDVQREWRRQGVKLQQFDAHDLAKAAKTYLSEHFDELVEQAARRLNETHN
jgi:aspartyl/asparaginyl beta-hydroxylase (cupin superfamily)